MIQGYFDPDSRPYFDCRLHIARFDVYRPIQLLFDTGADITSLHPTVSRDVGIPFDSLRDPQTTHGIGGGEAEYFSEDATLFFIDGDVTHLYYIAINIAKPNGDNWILPSILGRDIFDFWSTYYDPFSERLESEARFAHLTLPNDFFTPSSS